MRDKVYAGKSCIISIFKIISQAAIIFSFMILFIIIIGNVFGDSVKEFSTMFQLGSSGVASSTVLQVVVSSLIISCLKAFLFSEKYFGNMMVLWRSVILILSIFIMIICFVIIFGWFPMDNVSAWISFILSFGVCTGVSTIIMVIKTKSESEKYDRLLTDYKNGKGNPVDSESNM